MGRVAAPYLLILPSLVLAFGIIGYPVYQQQRALRNQQADGELDGGHLLLQFQVRAAFAENSR